MTAPLFEEGPREKEEHLTEARMLMGRYLVLEELPPETREGLVPVRVGLREPVCDLSYLAELEVAGALVPEPWMMGEWPHLSASYWEMLDRLGVERIADELAAISARHGNPDGRHGGRLILLDHDDPSRGNLTPRVTFACWWEEQTGEPVPELLGDGRMLHYTDLPKRTRPKKPKVWREDRRWRDAPDVPYPPTEEDVLRWIGAVHWQTARSPRNPHQYNIRDWGPPEPFLRVALWIREHGEQEEWGGDSYWYKRVGGHKYWTMGSVLESTVVLNRKEWGADPQDGQPDLMTPEDG